MGAHTFSSFCTCWTCSCGHTVENDDVVHALGYNRLIGLVQSRHDETTEVLCEFVGRLGFTATCAPGLVTFSQTSCSSITWPLPTFAPPLAPLAMPLLFVMPKSAVTTLPTSAARDMHSARSL
jgi:hypothetical protein